MKWIEAPIEIEDGKGYVTVMSCINLDNIDYFYEYDEGTTAVVFLGGNDLLIPLSKKDFRELL